MTPYQQFDKKCKKVQHFSNKWLKTAHLQLSQKSFKACLRKLTIIASFIHHKNLLIFFLIKKSKKINEKSTKKKRKKAGQIFFLKLFEIAQKKVPRGTPSTLSTPFQCFWRGWSRRGHWKKNKNFKKIKKSAQIFFFFFSTLPPKRCPGGRRLHPQRPQSVFEENEAEEAT